MTSAGRALDHIGSLLRYVQFHTRISIIQTHLSSEQVATAAARSHRVRRLRHCRCASTIQFVSMYRICDVCLACRQPALRPARAMYHTTTWRTPNLNLVATANGALRRRIQIHAQLHGRRLPYKICTARRTIKLWDNRSTDGAVSKQIRNK